MVKSSSYIYYKRFQSLAIFKTNFKEMMLVQTDPKLYFFIAQGMTVIDNVDDNEEMKATDEAFDILQFKQVKLFAIIEIF